MPVFPLPPRHRRRAALVLAATALSVLTAAGCGQLALKERELTFRVEPGTARWYTGTPAGIVDLMLPVTAGTDIAGGPGKGSIHAWWWPSQQPDAPAILYLHGARWNLTGQLFRIEQLHAMGFSVLAIDYRGFGKSEGDYPSEDTVYEDARAAWKHLATLQPDPAKRLIYGHSLGGAVAVDLAAALPKAGMMTAAAGAADRGAAALPPAAGLIVESSFSSFADIARVHTAPWLPVGLFLSQKFDSAGKIAGIDLPVLIVHGTGDKVVPHVLSERLHAAARGRKKLLLVEGGTHNNSMRLGNEDYRRALQEMFGWPPRS